MKEDKNYLEKIKNCFLKNKVYYTNHAKKEMQVESFGRIYENEVYESILSGNIIKSYLDDKPYPSFLILGITNKKRLLHLVCSYDKEDDLTIVITTYEPDPQKWVNYRERKR